MDDLKKEESLKIHSAAERINDELFILSLSSEQGEIEGGLVDILELESSYIDALAFTDNKGVRFFEKKEGFTLFDDFIKVEFSGESGLVEVYSLNRSSEKMEQVEKVFVTLSIVSVIFLFLMAWYLKSRFHGQVERLAKAFEMCQTIDADQYLANDNLKQLIDRDFDSLLDALDFVKQARIDQTKMEDTLKEKVSKAVSSKNAFIASMAHDFKTPLISMSGLTQNLSELNFKDGKEGVDELNMIVRAMSYVVYDMETIVLNVLDLSKMESGEKLVLEESESDIYQLALSVIRSYSYLADKKSNYITLEINSQVSTGFVDVLKYRQVVRNLLSNAIKYTENGNICIRITCDDHRLLTEVIDSGIGVAKTVMPSMFEPFKRDKDDLTEGTGIGLSFSQAMLSQFDRKIEFQNNKEKGARFWFEFPFKPTKNLNIPREKSLSVILVENKVLKKHVIDLSTFSLIRPNIDLNELNEKDVPGVVFVDSFMRLEEMDSGVVTTLNVEYIKKNQDAFEKIKEWIKSGIPVFHVFKDASFDAAKVRAYGFNPVSVNELSVLGARLLDSASESDELKLDIPNDVLSKKILIAEDNMVYSTLIVKRLEKLGFKSIKVVENGFEAVSEFRDYHPDIVMMDHMMPVMDGIEASKVIKGMDSSVLIIGFTAAKSEIKKGSSDYMDAVFIKDLTNCKDPVRTIIEYFKDKK